MASYVSTAVYCYYTADTWPDRVPHTLGRRARRIKEVQGLKSLKRGGKPATVLSICIKFQKWRCFHWMHITLECLSKLGSLFVQYSKEDATLSGQIYRMCRSTSNSNSVQETWKEILSVMTTYSQESLLQLVIHFNKIKGYESKWKSACQFLKIKLQLYNPCQLNL